ncbi:MAG: SdrD B-like domain-containing protein, partial [Waterburya sp.]
MAILNFGAEGAREERGAESFQFPQPLPSLINDLDGLTVVITATYDDPTTPEEDAVTAFPYLDGLFVGRPGGLGVARALTNQNQANPGGDDNLTEGETVKLAFSEEVTFSELLFRDEFHRSYIGQPALFLDYALVEVDEERTYFIQLIDPTAAWEDANSNGIFDPGLDTRIPLLPEDGTPPPLTGTTFEFSYGDVEDDDDQYYIDTATIFRLAKLGDFVWEDLNANGLQEADEPGINGVTVKLLSATGAVLQTTTTGAGTDDPDTPGDESNGYYEFAGLTPGVDYKVMFTQPTGFNSVSPFQVEDDDDPAIDSDANPGNGLMSDVVVLESGKFNRTIDAGFYN